MNNKIETATFQPEDFRQSLDEILSRQLTPETIDSYANSALIDLIELTEQITREYGLQPTVADENPAQLEDKAFMYFGLGELEESLDHVADVADSIRRIDEVIKNAIVKDGTVITPPAYREVSIQSSDGSFGEKGMYERLKTTLFILQQDFGIDIHNQERLRLTTGTTEGSMRKASYNFIEVPELERIILVCDEEGNATYVFDSAKLKEYDEDLDISQLTKAELNNMIQAVPNIGQRIRYSGQFINKIRAAIEDSSSEQLSGAQEATSGEAVNYLKVAPEAPIGYLNVYGIHKKLGVTRDRINKAIDTLGDALGEVKEYRSKAGAPTRQYSPDQIELIYRFLQDTNAYAEVIPEGFYTINSIRKELNLGNVGYILDAIEVLKDELGEIKFYRVANVTAKACSPYQFGLIKQYLEQHTTAFAVEAPEGIMSNHEIAACYEGVTVELINIALKEIEDDPVASSQLGEITVYKFHNKPSYGYTPEQVKFIVEYVRKRGSLSNASKLKHKP